MKNRISLALVVLSLTLLTLHNVSAEEAQVVFDDTIEHGGYVGIAFKLTTIDEEVAYMMGLRASWIIDHFVSLGVAAYGHFQGVLLDVERDYDPEVEEVETDQRTSVAYGGFDLGVVLFSDWLVHLTLQSLFGGGHIWFSDIDLSSIFAVIEPSAYIELNVTTWFRICLGGGYRFALGVSGIEGLDDEKLSGITGEIIFKVGEF
jgi:hypothetical protein